MLAARVIGGVKSERSKNLKELSRNRGCETHWLQLPKSGNPQSAIGSHHAQGLHQIGGSEGEGDPEKAVFPFQKREHGYKTHQEDEPVCLAVVYFPDFRFGMHLFFVYHDALLNAWAKIGK